jgi:hypothetical protein
MQSKPEEEDKCTTAWEDKKEEGGGWVDGEQGSNEEVLSHAQNENNNNKKEIRHTSTSLLAVVQHGTGRDARKAKATAVIPSLSFSVFTLEGRQVCSSHHPSLSERERDGSASHTRDHDNVTLVASRPPTIHTHTKTDTRWKQSMRVWNGDAALLPLLNRMRRENNNNNHHQIKRAVLLACVKHQDRRLLVNIIGH